jgi:uncharacterized protein YndB with AHSA1/START domain
MTPASDPSGPMVFTVERIFAAPRDLVFKVWTNPRYVALWWGVDGATNPRCELDVRPGGKWRIDMRTASGVVYPNQGVFLEVVDNERLVYSDLPVPDSPAWGGAPPGPLEHTVLFADTPDGGTRVSITVRADSAADCARLLKHGMREGLGHGLARLARLLIELARNDSS